VADQNVLLNTINNSHNFNFTNIGSMASHRSIAGGLREKKLFAWEKKIEHGYAGCHTWYAIVLPKTMVSPLTTLRK
jgi:hypothetical protein